MNRPIPHIGRTIAQIDKGAVRRRLESQLRQLDREEQAANWQPTPVQFVAENDEAPQDVTWRDVLAITVIDVVITLATLAVMAAFGLILREPVRHLLVVLGVLQ